MADENQKYELKLGRWGTVAVSGVLGLLAITAAGQIAECHSEQEPPVVDAGLPSEDAGSDVIDADLGEDAAEPSDDAGLELPPSQ